MRFFVKRDALSCLAVGVEIVCCCCLAGLIALSDPMHQWSDVVRSVSREILTWFE